MKSFWLAMSWCRHPKIHEHHIMPLADKVPHTMPMCWCKPVIKGTQAMHRPIDGREIPKW